MGFIKHIFPFDYIHNLESIIPLNNYFKSKMYITTKKQIIASFAIAVTSFIGDKNAENHENPLILAINDNATHALIGALTWIGIFITRTSKTDLYFIVEIFLCAFCSSIIDLDHFITAKSIHLKNATNLKNRPFLHCTTLAILIVSSVLLFSYFYKLNRFYKFGWILATAFISHHIRDSKRRGFWLWPFGHTRPIPSFIHLIAQMFLPQCLGLVINMFSFEMLKSEFVSRIETV